MRPATITAARRSLRRVHGNLGERDAVANVTCLGQALTCAAPNADQQASRRSWSPDRPGASSSARISSDGRIGNLRPNASSRARPLRRRRHNGRLPRHKRRLDQALADFVALYADQNELDYAALATPVKTGRVKPQNRALTELRQSLGRRALLPRIQPPTRNASHIRNETRASRRDSAPPCRRRSRGCRCPESGTLEGGGPQGRECCYFRSRTTLASRRPQGAAWTGRDRTAHAPRIKAL
jgi:hypothetical protein